MVRDFGNGARLYCAWEWFSSIRLTCSNSLTSLYHDANSPQSYHLHVPGIKSCRQLSGAASVICVTDVWPHHGMVDKHVCLSIHYGLSRGCCYLPAWLALSTLCRMTHLTSGSWLALRWVAAMPQSPSRRLSS